MWSTNSRLGMVLIQKTKNSTNIKGLTNKKNQKHVQYGIPQKHLHGWPNGKGR